MNPYQFKVTCDVCGGEGVGTIRTSAAAWDARSTIAHTDPRVCRDELARRRREIDALAEEIKQAVKV